MAAIRRAWRQPWVRRTLTVAVLVFVLALLIRQARVIDWPAVLEALRAYRRGTLALALSLAALSYSIYACFDLLGRSYLRSALRVTHFMSTGFIAYAFNQSLGALIGTFALRFRLYSRLGLNGEQISKLVALSVITNWLGYTAIASVVFLSGFPLLPAGFQMGDAMLRTAGAIAGAIAIAYLVMCIAKGGESLLMFKRSVPIPNIRLAALQLLLSAAHWPATASILYVLFEGRVEFATILGGLLVTVVATLAIRVPAGIGVLEAVFVGLLQARMPMAQILAALLAFRVIYHVLPLTVAALAYLKTELTHAPRTRRSAQHVSSG